MSYETPEFARMLGRMVDAYGRRVADAEPADLVEMLAIRERLDAAIGQAVRGQRARHGYSWADIGSALGTTRQNAQQRWGKDPR